MDVDEAERGAAERRHLEEVLEEGEAEDGAAGADDDDRRMTHRGSLSGRPSGQRAAITSISTRYVLARRVTPTVARVGGSDGKYSR
jgi:phosphohistidine phosphatase SixA